MAWLRTIAVLFGFGMVALIGQQFWAISQENFDLVLFPGPGNVMVLLGSAIFGFVALRFGLARIDVVSVIATLFFTLVLLMGAGILLVTFVEVMSGYYELPHVGFTEWVPEEMRWGTYVVPALFGLGMILYAFDMFSQYSD